MGLVPWKWAIAYGYRCNYGFRMKDSFQWLVAVFREGVVRVNKGRRGGGRASNYLLHNVPQFCIRFPLSPEGGKRKASHMQI